MKKSRKLVLKKTTLHTLEGESLDRVAGGGITLLCTISIFRSVIGCDPDPIPRKSFVEVC